MGDSEVRRHDVRDLSLRRVLASASIANRLECDGAGLLDVLRAFAPHDIGERHHRLVRWLGEPVERASYVVEHSLAVRRRLPRSWWRVGIEGVGKAEGLGF